MISCWSYLTQEFRPGEAIPWPLFFFKNRWCRAVSYSLVAAFGTCFYHGWQHIQDILIRDGVYAWKCPSDWQGPGTCDEQYDAIQTLYTLAVCAESTLSILTGFMLDNLGPQITGCVGQLTFFLSLVMLAISSQSLQLYMPAFFLVSASINFTGFPSVVLCDFFPRYPKFAISYMIAFQNLSAFIAPSLKSIWDRNLHWSFFSVIFGYALFALVFGIWFTLSLPLRRWKTLPPFDAHNSAECEDILLVPMRKRAVTGKSSLADLEPLRLVHAVEDVQSVASFPAVPQPSVGSRMKQLKTELLTHEWLMFTIAFYVIVINFFAYYPTTTKDQWGDELSNFFGWVNTSNILFALSFGFLVDLIYTLPIVIVIHVMSIILLVCALIPNYSLQYFTVILFVISNSFIYTTKYCYYEEVFQVSNFGMLVGISGTAAGLIVLANIPVQRAHAYNATFAVYLALLVAGLPFIIYLFFRGLRKNGYKKESIEDDGYKNESTIEVVEAVLKAASKSIAKSGKSSSAASLAESQATSSKASGKGSEASSTSSRDSSVASSGSS